MTDIVNTMSLEDWKGFVSTTATISTVISFLTGLQVVRAFVRKGSTGDTSGLPFVAGALNCAVWLKYGIFIDEFPMIAVNAIGTILLTSYALCYYSYTSSKLAIQKQLVFALGFYATLYFYVNSMEEESETARQVLGLVASTLSVGFFASPLASLAHVIRTGSTEALPFPIILSSFFVSGQWWLYGIILDDNFVKVPNFFGWCLASFQLLLFVYYPSKSRKYSLPGSNDD